MNEKQEKAKRRKLVIVNQSRLATNEAERNGSLPNCIVTTMREIEDHVERCAKAGVSAKL